MKSIKCKLTDLIGKKISRIVGLEKDSTRVSIFTNFDNEYIFSHHQECCEEVSLIDFEGDPEDFVDADIIDVDLSSKEGVVDNKEYSDKLWTQEEIYASQTWHFYRIYTTKGTIFMRWWGGSNGYYSEKVDLTLKLHLKLV